MRFSINLDLVYGGKNYIEAIREVKSLGFDHIEINFMQDKVLDELQKVQKETGIGVELMLSEFVNLGDGSKKDEFIDAIKEKLKQAETLGCKKIILASGEALEDISHEEQLKNIEAGIIEMIPLFEAAGSVMLLEPINKKIDHRETNLWSSKESFDMVRRINSKQVRILYDIYHMQIMEGDVIRTILENIDIIDHLHCAGNPGRHELFIGEINYPEILRYIQKAGFCGCVGIEYTPTLSPREGLLKVKEMFAAYM